MVRIRLIFSLTVVGTMLFAACVGCDAGAEKAAANPSPAKVAKVANEGELNTLVLTPEAERRLGIVIAKVENRRISRIRTYGGEIALPPGASLVVSAPVGGTLAAPSGGEIPSVGTLVAARQPLLLLTPLLSPERDVLTPAERLRLAEAKNALATSRIDAQGQVEQAKVQVEAAHIALTRAERLLRESAGTAAAVDDAQAQVNLATKSLEAAQSRSDQLAGVDLESEAGQQTPLVIESPQAGMIRSQSAAAGAVVAAGAPLLEVMRFDPIWLRIPVYAGETSELAEGEPAQVVPLNSDAGASGLLAQPVAAPPTATLLAATIDLYYQLPNPEGALRPGQRMTVRLPLADQAEQRVIPWSAVIHDIHGGSWVYVRTAPHTYVRHRVQVRYVTRDKSQEFAVLQDGPQPGQEVVTTAVVELFGTEFGFAK